MTFHLRFVHIIFSLVWVAYWPLLGKELLALLTIYSLYILTICNFIYSRFGFEDGLWALIASVPSDCKSVTFKSIHTVDCYNKVSAIRRGRFQGQKALLKPLIISVHITLRKHTFAICSEF